MLFHVSALASGCAWVVALGAAQCAVGTRPPVRLLIQGRAGSAGEVWRSCIGLEEAGRGAQA